MRLNCTSASSTLALGAQREAVEIEHGVDLAELRILVEQARVEPLRRGRGRAAAAAACWQPALCFCCAALLDGGVVGGHLRQELRLRLLPLELGELEDDLGASPASARARAGRSRAARCPARRLTATIASFCWMSASTSCDTARLRASIAGLEARLLVLAAGPAPATPTQQHERRDERAICSSRTHPPNARAPAANTPRRRR